MADFDANVDGPVQTVPRGVYERMEDPLDPRRRRSNNMLMFCLILGCFCLIPTISLIVAAATSDGSAIGAADDDDDSSSASSSASSSSFALPPTPPTPSPPESCCPQDPFVYFGSPYASASPTLCNNHDYNCDGVDEMWPCCASSDTVANVHDARRIYLVETCNANDGQPLSRVPNEVCGACIGHNDVVPGWACVSGLDSSSSSSSSSTSSSSSESSSSSSSSSSTSSSSSSSRLWRKRNVLSCPEECIHERIDVTPYNAPSIGECAEFIDRCVDFRAGDGETCCIVAGA